MTWFCYSKITTKYNTVIIIVMAVTALHWLPTKDFFLIEFHLGDIIQVTYLQFESRHLIIIEVKWVYASFVSSENWVGYKKKLKQDF